MLLPGFWAAITNNLIPHTNTKGETYENNEQMGK